MPIASGNDQTRHPDASQAKLKLGMSQPGTHGKTERGKEELEGKESGIRQREHEVYLIRFFSEELVPN